MTIRVDLWRRQIVNREFSFFCKRQKNPCVTQQTEKTFFSRPTFLLENTRRYKKSFKICREGSKKISKQALRPKSSGKSYEAFFLDFKIYKKVIIVFLLEDSAAKEVQEEELHEALLDLVVSLQVKRGISSCKKVFLTRQKGKKESDHNFFKVCFLKNLFATHEFFGMFWNGRVQIFSLFMMDLCFLRKIFRSFSRQLFNIVDWWDRSKATFSKGPLSGRNRTLANFKIGEKSAIVKFRIVGRMDHKSGSYIKKWVWWKSLLFPVVMTIKYGNTLPHTFLFGVGYRKDLVWSENMSHGEWKKTHSWTKRRQKMERATNSDAFTKNLLGMTMDLNNR